MTSFRLDKGRPVSRVKADGPSPSVPEKPSRTRNRASGAVGTLVCGHMFYEPYTKRGKLVWCEECQHNREIKPKPKPTGGVVSDQEMIPF